MKMNFNAAILGVFLFYCPFLSLSEDLQNSSAIGTDWVQTIEDNSDNQIYSKTPKATAVAPTGEGTEATPYLIADINNLLWLSENIVHWDKYYLQTVDIDATETNTWNGGAGWSPIGSTSNYFTGTYDGGGHSITGLYLYRPGTSYVGMFGYMSSGTIKNLHLLAVNIHGVDLVGGLAGISGVSNIINCSVEGTVKGNSSVGGLVGQNGSGSNISNSFAQGLVEGSNMVGGLVGYNFSGSSISDCHSHTEVVGSDHNNGGLVGSNYDNCTIENSYAKGSVTGTYYIGGLVGSNSGNSVISNCYSLCSVHSDSWGIGGLVGHNQSAVNNSYAAGNMSQLGSSGGLIGYDNSGSVSQSFWDVETTGYAYTGQNVSIWGSGLSTANMKLKSTYINAGWPFVGDAGTEIWNIGNGRNIGYPYIAAEFPYDPADNPPVLTTTTFSIISDSEVTVNGSIEFIGSPTPYQHGFCYGNVHDPTLNDMYVELGAPAHDGAFSAQLTGLSTDLYFVRAYAVTDNGVSYGNAVSFIPFSAPEGSGTMSDPYKISSLGNLYWLSENSSQWDKHYIQTANVDASPTQNWNGGAGWKPIGTDSNPFSGSFNGGGFHIDHLYINRPSQSYIGFFGKVVNSLSLSVTLQNINITNVNITGNSYLGGIVGYAGSGNQLYFKRCFVTGVIGSNGSYVGGIAGTAHATSIDQSAANVIVSGLDYIGGVVGYSEWGTVIQNSYARGDISGIQYIGGVSGYVYASVNSSYSAVKVSGSNYVGGLVGGKYEEATSVNSYFDTQVATNTYSAMGLGRTTDQMTSPYDANTYQDWNFDGIWGEDHDYSKNDGYPYLIGNYLPQLTSLQPKNILSTSVTTGGVVLSEGQAAVTIRGIVWAKTDEPRVDSYEGIVEQGTGPGEFSVSIQNLTPNTVYHLRAFATNSYGTSYGNTFAFKTYAPGGSVQDVDGNLYPTVQISNQIWMAKNLGVKRYNNGDEITTGLDYNSWINTTDGAYAIYDHTQVSEIGSEEEMLRDYGALYNGYALADTRGLCPTGWRIPHSDDWSILEGVVDTEYGVGDNVWDGYGGRGTDVGYKLKSQNGWYNENNGDDAFGFRALPAGMFDGNYYQFNQYTYWWTSADNIARQLAWDYYTSFKSSYDIHVGLSLRCLKNNSIVTAEATEITTSTAKIEVTVIDNGFNVVGRGLVWGISPNPTVDNNVGIFEDAHGTVGSFVVLLDNLEPNTTYYARGTAVIDGVMEYGNEVSFTTTIPVEDFAGGTGTIEDPYLVANAAQLNNVRNFLGSHFLQVANIDLSGSAWTNNEGWNPIGDYGYDQNYTANFYGTYNGDFYAISNLTINRSTENFVGLFGSTWSIDGNVARIKNLKLTNVNVIGSGAVGGLIGNVDLDCIVENCSVEGSIQGNGGIGGLAGNVENGARIKGSCFKGDVSSASDYNVGGLAGYVAGYIENSYARGSVSGSNRVGGLVGTVWWGEIKNSYSTAQVSGSSEVGGLIGYAEWDHSPVFTNSYWDYETSGHYGSATGEGRYTNDMTYPYETSTYVDWDFTNIWGEDTEFTINNGYPFLKALAFGPPTLTTEPVVDVTPYSAKSGGNITSDGGDGVSARGVVWGTSQNPSLEDNTGYTADGTGIGGYISNLTGLIPNATYYVRAYATNSHGTAYGNQLHFTTPPDKDVPTVKMFGSSLAIGTSDARWNMVAPNFIDRGTATIDNNSSYWKMGWDANSLYVKVVISDNNFCDQWCTGYNDQNWMADRIELYFNVSSNLNPPDDHGVNPELQNDFYLGYHQITSEFQDQVTQLSKTLTNIYPHYTDYYHAYSIDGSTISYEFEIPWSSLVAQDIAFSPSDGKEFGFDVKYKDWDNAQEVGEHNWWSEFSKGWYQINTIGSVKLSSQTVEEESIPVVITNDIFEISEYSAMAGGEIYYNGGSNVITKGIVWSTSANPTLENNTGLTDNGSGDAGFSGELTNLAPNTTYFVRAYATNSIGTGYGQERVFSTLALSGYTVYYNNPEFWDEVYIWMWGGDGSFTDLWPGEPMTAPSDGSIWYSFEVPPSYTNLLFNNKGNALKTIDLYRDKDGWFDGVQWYDHEPFNTLGTIADADGNLYRTVIIGEQVWMDQNLKTTTYSDGSSIDYNSSYTWYGENSDFKHIYGALYSGYAVIDSRGLCPDGWKVPSVDDFNVLVDYLGGSEVAGGKLKSLGDINSGTGIWEQPNTDATNESGFKGVPGGYGGGLMNQAGFWWSGSLATITTENDAAFYLGLYYNSSQAQIAPFVLNDFNSVRCLRLAPASVPVLQTIQVSDITPTSAISGGEFTQGDNVTEKGVVWSLTSNPTLEDYLGKTSNGSGDGAFTSSITGLTPETTYYVRAYAINNLGVGYGQVEQFTTEPPSVPSLSTKPVTLLSATSAKSGGNITSDGASPITAKGIVWSTSQNPTIVSYTGITNSGSGDADFESEMTSLSPGSRYYVRAFATNDIGTAYGNEVTFSTAHSIVFKVISQGGSPISGATINFDQETLNSDSYGSATFYRVDGTYTYTVNASGYIPVSGEAIVSGAAVDVKLKLLAEGSSSSQIIGEQSVCLGSEVIYYFSGTSGGTWGVVGGEILENNSDNVLVRWTSSSGDAVIGYRTVDNSGYMEVDQVSVTVNASTSITQQDKPDIYRKGHLNILICTKQSSTYKWYRNGSHLAGQSSQYYVAGQQAGEYRVQVLTSQCPHTSESLSITGTASASSELTVFPNPSRGQFTLALEFGTERSSELSISSAYGAIVYRETVPAMENIFEHRVALDGLAPGIYLVTLRVDGDIPLTTKLTIQ